MDYAQLVTGASLDLEGTRHKFVKITNGAWLYRTVVIPSPQTGASESAPNPSKLVTVGSKIPGAGLGAGMFELWFALIDDQKIGVILKTPHQYIEDPDYVAAFTASGRGRAQVSETLLKTEDLVIWNFPNRGTIAACPVEGPELQTIFEEQ